MAIITVAADSTETIGGGAGDDRYVFNPALIEANAKYTITDTLGSNTIQLDGDLAIASSQVTANAMLLTLTNGAVITILGADSFTFQTGGDGTTGVGGTLQTFSEFVTTGLGIAAVPAAGAPAATGGAVTVQETGGTTGGGTTPPVDPTDPLAAYNAAAATAAASLAAAQTAQAAADAAEAAVTDLASAQAYLTAANAAKTAADKAVTDAAAATTAAAAAQTAAGATADPADDAPAAAAVAAAQTAAAAATAAQTTAAAEVVTATAAVGANTPASNANFTDAVGEVVTGGPGNDTFNGVYVTGTKADSTINVGDTLDGLGGSDTLNIITTGGTTATGFPAGFSTKNVENVFINNEAMTAVDANTFSGLQQLWFVNNNANVTASNLKETQTLGVKGDTGATKVTGDFGSSKTVNVALDKAKGAVELASSDASKAGTVNISGSSLETAGAAQTVTVTGKVGSDAMANASTVNVTGADKLKVDTSAATNAETLNVKGSGNVEFTAIGGSTKTVDASTNTGGTSMTGVADTQTVKGGSGVDLFSIGGGPLKSEGTIMLAGGNDMVDINGNAIDKGAKIDLGADNDSIVNTGAAAIIDKGATVDGGAGSDTLGLSLVGAANVGAFSNFEIFDVVGLNIAAPAPGFDLDILAAKNTVTEIVGSGALAGATTLLNVGAGVGFRATKDMGATALTLDQKTPGAITVTLDADTTKATTTTPAPIPPAIEPGDDATTTVILEDATSAKAVFTSNIFDAETTTVKNDQTINLTTKAATTLEVNSTGTNVSNALVVKDQGDSNGATTAGGNSLLTKITVTGDAALDATGLTFGVAAGVTAGPNAPTVNKLMTIDASAQTGGLTVDLGDLANGGTLSIGSGSDVVKILSTDSNITAATIEKVSGFEKAASTSIADVKVADLIDSNQTLTVGVEDVAGTLLDVSKGVVTFTGAGPSSLDQAVTQVAAAVTTANSAVLFEYIGNSYVFVENDGGAGGTDNVVQLVGVTGVTEIGISTSSAGDLYIV